MASKFAAVLAILSIVASPIFAYEEVTCQKNATQNIITSITDANNFCTMMTGYAVDPVAPNEGCASVYCHGDVKNGAEPMPAGYILSSNFAQNKTAKYIQITGCINSAVWAQNATDDGGQMDSHGWPYSCAGYNKFVSLIEPATNTFCIRCCTSKDNSDCDTSKSTDGCWNVIPGLYTMADGTDCKKPSELAALATPPTPTNISVTPTPTPSVVANLPGVNINTNVGVNSPVGAGKGSSANGSPSFSAMTTVVVALFAIVAAAF
ncbi:hypothetical protein BGW38_005879 [Lunasporangiospora selenospora]|uniref:Secreted protein n=1 Tax=Lunasporangiospora selenospora TaxID=979761 RepID=A0A9P6FNA1_9FUNG|nr:hypothetical protein BGW38_005879 [Lunasporangiospora selenospora]